MSNLTTETTAKPTAAQIRRWITNECLASLFHAHTYSVHRAAGDHRPRSRASLAQALRSARTQAARLGRTHTPRNVLVALIAARWIIGPDNARAAHTWAQHYARNRWWGAFQNHVHERTCEWRTRLTLRYCAGAGCERAIAVLANVPDERTTCDTCS